MTTIWHARLATTHFEFEAIGLTKEEAQARLIDGLHVHCQDYAADIHAILGDDEDDWTDQFNTNELTTGYWYRDGFKQMEVLPPSHKYSAADDDDGEWDQAEEDARLRGALRDLER